MAFKKKWLALALVIVALLASLQSMPRSLIVEISLPGTAAYVSNPTPFGTSILARSLEEAGYTVKPVAGVGDLASIDLNGYTDLVYLIVAPQNLTLQYAREITQSLNAISEKYGVRVHVVVFDELGLPGEAVLLRSMGDTVCPGTPYIKINNTVPANEYATILFSDGVRLATGYTSNVEAYVITGGKVNVVSPKSWGAPPALPQQVAPHEEILAAVTPAPDGYSPVWVPLAIGCSTPEGSIVAVADSTPAVNLATSNNTEYIREDIKLITYGIPRDNRTIIVADGALYTNIANNLAIRLHPSFLLIAASAIYSRLEQRGLELVNSLGLRGLLLVLAGSIVMVSTWGASTFASRKGEKTRWRQRRKEASLAPQPSIRRGLSGIRGIIASREAMDKACAEAARLLKSHSVRELAYSMSDPGLREIVVADLAELESLCSRRGFPGPLPLWGLRARRVRALVREVLSLLRIEPLEGVWGGGVEGLRK